MFFYASKIVWTLLQPSFLTGLIVFAGGIMVLLHWREALGRKLLAAGLLLLALIGFSPLSIWLLLPLEERFPRVPLPEQVAGIIVLGGFEDIDISLARNALAINDNAERLTEGLVLAKRRPQAKLIFTGGEANIIASNESAADAVGTFRRQGFDVVPWPVDYRTVGPSSAFWISARLHGGLSRMDFVFKEWVGLIAYRVSGRTDALWPGPEKP